MVHTPFYSKFRGNIDARNYITRKIRLNGGTSSHHCLHAKFLLNSVEFDGI